MTERICAPSRRSPRAPLLAAVVCATVATGAAGCDRLTVSNVTGARVLLTISGPPEQLRTVDGEHLELWAREADGSILRLLSGRAAGICETDRSCLTKNGYAKTLHGYAMVPAVSLAEPCMIDEQGYLLYEPGARLYVADEEAKLTDADRQKRAEAVLARIRAITDRAASPMVAFVSYGDVAGKRPQFDLQDKPCGSCSGHGDYACVDGLCKARPEVRKSQCLEFFRQNPFAYVGNPLQLTAPRNGVFFGTADYTSFQPPQVIGGMNLQSAFGLRNLRELWVTQTKARLDALEIQEVDCKAKPDKCRGRVVLQGSVEGDDRGIFHVDLRSPLPGVSGHASVYTRLDTDPVLF